MPIAGAIQVDAIPTTICAASMTSSQKHHLSLAKRSVFAVVTTLLFFSAVEGILALVGFGGVYDFADAHLAFEGAEVSSRGKRCPMAARLT